MTDKAISPLRRGVISTWGLQGMSDKRVMENRSGGVARPRRLLRVDPPSPVPAIEASVKPAVPPSAVSRRNHRARPRLF
jgi:hypothetical protein